MEERDFRSIGWPEQERLRQRALVLLGHGVSQTEAARMVGVKRQTVNLWLKRYRVRGEDGVLDGRRVSPRPGQGQSVATRLGRSAAEWRTSCPTS